MNKTVTLTPIIALVGFFSYAQKSQKVEVKTEYELQQSNATTRLRLISLIPNDIEHKQTVNALFFSVEPDTIYLKGSNKYAEFNLLPPIPESIEITSILTINKTDYKNTPRSDSINKIDSAYLARYLQREPYIDSDHPDIINQAQKLRNENQITTLQNIYYFVNGYINYTCMPQTLGSVAALNSRKGDCTEFSHLMVALCRANSIPARYVYGLSLSSGNTIKHDWVEVYIDYIGWVPFDPTPGNNATFSSLNNRYIYFCTDGQDEEIMQQYYFYRSTYWGAKTSINARYFITLK